MITDFFADQGRIHRFISAERDAENAERLLSAAECHQRNFIHVVFLELVVEPPVGVLNRLDRAVKVAPPENIGNEGIASQFEVKIFVIDVFDAVGNFFGHHFAVNERQAG